MNSLAFDTATNACSVAVTRADGESFELRPAADRLLERPAHTTELLPAILELAAEAGLALGEIDRVIVGIGPGAFTGLRIGVATARAIASANGCELVAVSSLAALAEGGFTPVIDARRKEFYFRADGLDQLAGPDQAIERISAANKPAVGDGALLLRERLLAAGVGVPEANDPAHVVSALRLIALAEGQKPQKPAEVVPNYIRAPDAKVSSRESWLVGADR
jgi:tRNA threonylcarbamoyladenosine biosynthesis protein TsaB